jgi:hypothetical protein
LSALRKALPQAKSKVFQLGPSPYLIHHENLARTRENPAETFPIEPLSEHPTAKQTHRRARRTAANSLLTRGEAGKDERAFLSRSLIVVASLALFREID